MAAAKACAPSGPMLVSTNASEKRGKEEKNVP